MIYPKNNWLISLEKFTDLINETVDYWYRGSSLALNQANEVKEKILSNFDIKFKIKVVKTEGDIDLNTPSRKILDKGFYTKEIEKLLNDSKIDLAVHSMKDLFS